ncbi:snake venom 5'-nucleotidase-like [Ptychodera flava]|uniref:snake venom 5'-nucleotidase-like n=1 Tax=Ptychodera flava TaxID=63121 RepID=UPI00396A77EF
MPNIAHSWCVLALPLYLSSAVGLELVILHTNDIHARFSQANKYGGVCSDEDAVEQKCYGGVARIVDKVNELRDQHENVLLLDAGDQFQGTLWFYLYQGRAAAHFMEMIGYDAMAIGNHEFDNDIDGLLPFLTNVTFPVLSCNINDTDEPAIQGLYSRSATVTLSSGDVVGIVGYTTAETPQLSSPGRLLFNSEVDSVRAEVDRLRSQGINKIIALGHAGIYVDLQIADEVEGVDVIVGGHTNTFLYTGEPPSNEDPFGEYPLVHHPAWNTDQNVLIVQDYAFGKYLGYLNVTFDEDGNVTSWGGNPILLDHSVEQDNATLEDVQLWARPISSLASQVIGRTHVFLDGRRESCRLKECNLGNLIADAMVHQNIKHADEVKWSDVSIAIMNGGGVRSSVEGSKSVSIAHVMDIQPFRNTLDLMEITGATLLKVLEKSVSEYILEKPHGRFLQVSGLLVTYDLNRPVGQRVVEVEAKCSQCNVPEYFPLESDATYKLVMPTYLANGGDGYDMLVDERISYHIPGDLDTDVLIEYIETRTPITIGLERRIKFLQPSEPVEGCDVSSAAVTKNIYWLLLTSLFACAQFSGYVARILSFQCTSNNC